MSKEQKQLNAHLLFPGKCPVCSQQYESSDISVLNRRKNLLSAHVDCKNCQTSAVVALVTNLGFITTIGLTTDLDKQDIKKFSKMNPIDADEVLRTWAQFTGKKV